MIEEKERQKLRKKRQRARKRKKAARRMLIVLTVLVLVLSAFLLTVKLTNPDFDFSALVQNERTQQVVRFVREDVLKQTTTTTAPPTTAAPTTTEPTTKAAEYDYVEFSEFAFDTALQGNQLGNLLNKTQGAVTYSSSYIYYSIPGAGIYRFEPQEEKNKAILKADATYKYLNVLGDYLYFVDVDAATLNRVQVGGGEPLKVADNVAFAYLYNDTVYFISADNTVGYIALDGFARTELFTGQADKTISFAGISLSRLFFVQHDAVGDYYEYITVSLTDSNDRQYFKNDSRGNSILNLQLEGGFLYYYQKQDDGSYNLCRQKFGSEQIVTLLTHCSVTDYPVVYRNRLYYSAVSDGRMQAMELNMNSMDTKVMVNVSSTDATGTMAVGYGYQYVFLTGTRNEGGEFVFAGSCIYTSSSRDNTLIFSENGLKYLD